MKYVRAFFRRLFALLYLCCIKFFNFTTFHFHPLQVVSVSTRFFIETKGKIIFGKHVVTRRNVEFRVSHGGQITVGNNAMFNNSCTITCMDKINIGSYAKFGPNVMIYDHDHKFGINGVIKGFKTSQVTIGNNVWIGANSVILRGTTIGDNCVIGAGSVIKGNLPENSIVVQKRENIITKYE